MLDPRRVKGGLGRLDVDREVRMDLLKRLQCRLPRRIQFVLHRRLRCMTEDTLREPNAGSGYDIGSTRVYGAHSRTMCPS
jgi:hypothetical protein